jgi:hypothetical protein
MTGLPRLEVETGPHAAQAPFVVGQSFHLESNEIQGALDVTDSARTGGKVVSLLAANYMEQIPSSEENIRSPRQEIT